MLFTAVSFYIDIGNISLQKLLDTLFFQSHLYFTIGSVDSFERSLEQTQNDLGIDPSHFIPVVYVKEGEWLYVKR